MTTGCGAGAGEFHRKADIRVEGEDVEGLGFATGEIGLGIVIGDSVFLHLYMKLLREPTGAAAGVTGDLVARAGEVEDGLTTSFPLGDLIVEEDADSVTGVLEPQKGNPHPFLLIEGDVT